MKQFEMTAKQHEALLDACKPVPMIMLQCCTPSSPQENVNAAWEKLGAEMGFDHMTVKPVSEQPGTIFQAEQNDPNS